MKQRAYATTIGMIIVLAGCAQDTAQLNGVRRLPAPAVDESMVGEGAEMAQYHPRPTRALLEGSATRDEVKTWAGERFVESYLHNASEPQLQDIDWCQSGKQDLLVTDAKDALAGTGGQRYLAFELTERGYRFCGIMFAARVRPLPCDYSGRARLLLSTHLSSSINFVHLVRLEAGGLREIGRAEINSATDGTNGDDRVNEALFGAKTVSPKVLREVFGTVWTD